jgi:general stress protein 26
MKKFISLVLLFLGMLFCGSFTYAQKPTTPPAHDRAYIINIAKKVMLKAGACALVTNGDNGQPQSRVLDAFAPTEDLTVWFGTNSVSRKVKQIQKDAHVTLTYIVNPTGYVTLLGKAEIVTDPKEKQKHWKKEWKMFYKQENKGDDYTLIRFVPNRLEMVSYTDGLFNSHETGLPVILDLP